MTTLEWEGTRLVLARRLSQSDCREQAFADGSVWELGYCSNTTVFNRIRMTAEITAKMIDESEILDVWLEEVP